MSILFDSFDEWRKYCSDENKPLYEPVLRYEREQKGKSEEEVWTGLFQGLPRDARGGADGPTQEMNSFSGMINSGAKKVANLPLSVLSPEFQN